MPYVEPNNLLYDGFRTWDFLGEIDHLSPPYPRALFGVGGEQQTAGIMLPGPMLHGVDQRLGGGSELACAIYVPDATGGSWHFETDHNDRSSFYTSIGEDGNSEAALHRFPTFSADPYPPDVWTAVFLHNPPGIDYGEAVDTQQGTNPDTEGWGPDFTHALEATFVVPARRASRWVVDVALSGGLSSGFDVNVHARLDASPGGQWEETYGSLNSLSVGVARPDDNAWEPGEVTSLRLRLWTAGTDLRRIGDWSATLRREGVIPYYAAFYQPHYVGADPGDGGGGGVTARRVDIAAAGPSGRRRHTRRVIGARVAGVQSDVPTFVPPPAAT